MLPFRTAAIVLCFAAIGTALNGENNPCLFAATEASLPFDAICTVRCYDKAGAPIRREGENMATRRRLVFSLPEQNMRTGNVFLVTSSSLVQGHDSDSDDLSFFCGCSLDPASNEFQCLTSAGKGIGQLFTGLTESGPGSNVLTAVHLTGEPSSFAASSAIGFVDIESCVHDCGSKY